MWVQSKNHSIGNNGQIDEYLESFVSAEPIKELIDPFLFISGLYLLLLNFHLGLLQLFLFSKSVMKERLHIFVHLW